MIVGKFRGGGGGASVGGAILEMHVRIIFINTFLCEVKLIVVMSISLFSMYHF